MSLLRLLTAGKSLVGVKENGRYRKTHGLPNFSPNDRAATPPCAGKGLESVKAASPAPAGSVNPPPVSSSWLARWLSRRRRPAPAAIPRFNKALVQGELTLDRVKVLRNDLSDSDLEVVPVRAPVEKPRLKQPAEKQPVQTEVSLAQK
jgi:hypothetical protein